MKKVLVLGGTGAMGIHLVSILSNAGVKTVVTSRKYREAQKNIKYLQGNAHDISFLDAVLNEKWDSIVDFMVYSTNEFRGRVELLLKSTQQYVFFSSSRVFADSSKPITEESHRLLDVCNDKEYLKTDEYGLAKARQEDILKNSGFQNWTIIRPSVTFGENRLQLGELEKEHWLYRALYKRTIVLSRDIISKFATLTYGFDVSKGIYEIIGKNEAFGEIYNITVSEAHKWEEVLSVYLDTIKTITGNEPNVLILDKSPIPERYVVKYDKLFDRKYDNSKINYHVATNNFTPTLSGLKKCLEIFLSKPIFLPIDWKKEAFLDKLTGEFTPLYEIQTIKEKASYMLFRHVVSYQFAYKMHQIISRRG